MKNVYDVAIVGAGPAGLFAANRFFDSSLSVCVLEKGKRVNEREEALRSKSGDKKNLLEGVGGGGTFTDCKLNLTTRGIGGDLTSLGISEGTLGSLIDEVNDLFTYLGAPEEYSGTDNDALLGLEQRALNAGIEFVKSRQRHIGTSATREVIKLFYESLCEQGIDFSLSTEVSEIRFDHDLFFLETTKGIIKAHYVILAPGRASNHWLRDIMASFGASPSFGPIDIGVRVEVPEGVFSPLCEIMYDPKFKIRTSYDAQVRTFCTNPKGFVISEQHDNCVLVNGHADRQETTELTNFALLVKEPLTQPLSDTEAYGRGVAALCNILGCNRPLAQSLFDLKKERRSNERRLERLPFTPTLSEVTPGDLRRGLPAEILANIIEGLDRLSKIAEGLAYPEQVLLYAPEVKFFSDRHDVSTHMESTINNLFIAGDASGHTEGIPHAAASGILAAQGILKKEGLT